MDSRVFHSLEKNVRGQNWWKVLSIDQPPSFDRKKIRAEKVSDDFASKVAKGDSPLLTKKKNVIDACQRFSEDCQVCRNSVLPTRDNTIYVQQIIEIFRLTNYITSSEESKRYLS